MIPQNLAMSREARKLLNELDIMAQKNNITALVTPSQIYVADQLTMKYYTTPILNAIKSKVNQLKNKSSKHFTVEHWVSVLNSMFQSNMGVQRDGSPVQIIDGHDNGTIGFELISRFLPVDYSTVDAEIIYTICHQYTDDMIKASIKIANDNKVYNIQYIKAVLERAQALSNMKRQEIEKIRAKADNSNSVLDKQIVQHSVLDVATSKYSWEQAKANAELERKLAEKFGGI